MGPWRKRRGSTLFQASSVALPPKGLMPGAEATWQVTALW